MEAWTPSAQPQAQQAYGFQVCLPPMKAAFFIH
jgi:hypothetical protein